MKKCEINSFDSRWFGASENSKCGFGVQSLSVPGVSMIGCGFRANARTLCDAAVPQGLARAKHKFREKNFLFFFCKIFFCVK
jgi:hypothetical protein